MKLSKLQIIFKKWECGTDIITAMYLTYAIFHASRLISYNFNLFNVCLILLALQLDAILIGDLVRKLLKTIIAIIEIYKKDML